MTGRPYSAIDDLQQAAIDDLYALRKASVHAVRFGRRAAIRFMCFLFSVEITEQKTRSVFRYPSAPPTGFRASSLQALPLHMPVGHVLAVGG